MKKKLNYNKIQERTFNSNDLQLRAVEENDQKILEGYAATFGTRSKLLYNSFYEVLERSAFEDVLKREDLDVVFNFNHSNDVIMGRTTNNTLELRTDDKGLFFRAVLPNTTQANDLYELVKRGDISENSFAFMPAQDGYKVKRDKESNYDLVTVTKVDDLRDVSLVVRPAYPKTGTVARAEEDEIVNEPTDAPTDEPKEIEEMVVTFTIEKGTLTAKKSEDEEGKVTFVIESGSLVGTIEEEVEDEPVDEEPSEDEPEEMSTQKDKRFFITI